MPFQINVEKGRFVPEVLNAHVTDAAYWFNTDAETHQVCPQNGVAGDWGDPFVTNASSMQVNLDKAGTYAYRCALHDGESGSIVVTAMPYQVTIVPGEEGVTFSPDPIPANAAPFSVFWFNADAQPHQLYPSSGKPGDWGDAILSQSASNEILFTQSGTYPYVCALHTNETGTINVK
jgi:plastocyanin